MAFRRLSKLWKRDRSQKSTAATDSSSSAPTSNVQLPSANSVVLITEPSGSQKDYIIYSFEQEDSKPIIKQTATAKLPLELLSEHLFKQLPTCLAVPENEIHIIISTKSGTGKAEDTYQAVLEPLLAAIGVKEPLIHAVEKTTSHETIRAYANDILRKRANDGIQQTVLLLSGDGGVVDLVNGLLDGEKSGSFVQPKLALFPLGTGNALFHSIYRSVSKPETDDLVLALRTLLRGSISPLPIFRTEFSPGACVLSDEGRVAKPVLNGTLYGAVVASYGFHATLVADSDTTEYRQHGDKRFGMVAKHLLEDPHAYKARVTVKKIGEDSEAVIGSDGHAYVLLTLVSNLEKTFTISPSSKPLDGSMRMVHFAPMVGGEIMKIMTAAYDGGKHVTGEEKLVDYEELDMMKIEFLEDGEDGKWRRVCIDGLIVRIEEGGWMKVTKVQGNDGAVDLIAPKA